MANENGIVQEVKDAVQDNEHSIGERAPGAPFAIVGLSYMVVLAVACVAMGIVIWAMG